MVCSVRTASRTCEYSVSSLHSIPPHESDVHVSICEQFQLALTDSVPQTLFSLLPLFLRMTYFVTQASREADNQPGGECE